MQQTAFRARIMTQAIFRYPPNVNAAKATIIIRAHKNVINAIPFA